MAIKSIFLCLTAMTLGMGTASAVDDNTVEIAFNGSAATVSVASNISSYISNQSSGSHVKLVQSESFVGNSTGEITYILSGSSTNGEFYLEGSYKCTVEMQGLTLTNPSGPAINIQNGKRTKVSVKSGTTNTLTDGANDTYNGCLHCKGHTEFKGKGTLNIVGKSRHGIYSKEYVEVKNLTINVTAAPKDGIHCKEYFLMESGTVNITGASDDGIQVELSDDAATGVTAAHEEENSGNFYMTDGKLTISGYKGKAIKADGSITYTGGTQNFDTNDVVVNAGIDGISAPSGAQTVYDLNGRKINGAIQKAGIYIIRKDGLSRKVIR